VKQPPRRTSVSARRWQPQRRQYRSSSAASCLPARSRLGRPCDPVRALSALEAALGQILRAALVPPYLRMPGVRQPGSIRPTQEGVGSPYSPDVNVRAAVPIRFGAAYHLAGHGRDFPDTEEEEAEEVRCRVAFGPFEVDAWPTSSLVPHGHQ
jgi:hypothetical protein